MLRPGGIVIILDVVGNKGPIDRLWAAKAMPVALALRLLHTGRLTEPRDDREAWAAHAHTDRYGTIMSPGHRRAGSARKGSASIAVAVLNRVGRK